MCVKGIWNKKGIIIITTNIPMEMPFPKIRRHLISNFNTFLGTKVTIIFIYLLII
jgi:hypothetical protein